MKIGCYGYDRVFGNLFPPIVEEIKNRGYEHVVFPPQIRGIAASRMAEMLDCRVVLLGLSSFQTQEELVLAEKLAGLGIPVVIIEDVPGSALRPKAKSFAPKATALFLALETGRKDAEKFGYRPECIYYLGPPSHWGKSYHEMISIDRSVIRAQFRKRYGNGEPQLLEPHDIVVYVAGTKKPSIVNNMLRLTIEAGCSLIGRDNFILYFGKHVGEKPEKPDEEELFAKAFAEREKLFSGLQILDAPTLTNPQRYATADLVVTSGGPNETITGAYARLSMLYYSDDDSIKFMKESGSENGKWFVAELGGMYEVGPETFLDGMRFMLTSEGRNWVRARQEENFPLPDTWDTATRIIDFLENVSKTG